MAEIPQYQTKFEYQNRYAGRAQARFSPTGFQVPQEQDTITDRVWKGVTGKVMEVGSQVAKERKLFEEQSRLSDETSKMRNQMESFRNRIGEIAGKERIEGETYREAYQRLWTKEAKEIENQLEKLPVGRIRDAATEWFAENMQNTTSEIATEAVDRDDIEFMSKTDLELNAAIASGSVDGLLAGFGRMESRPDKYPPNELATRKKDSVVKFAQNKLTDRLIDPATGEPVEGWEDILINFDPNSLLNTQETGETQTSDQDELDELMAGNRLTDSPVNEDVEEEVTDPKSEMETPESQFKELPVIISEADEETKARIQAIVNRTKEPSAMDEALATIGIEYDPYEDLEQPPLNFFEENRMKYGDIRNWPTEQQAAISWNSGLKKDFPEQWKAVQKYREEIAEKASEEKELLTGTRASSPDSLPEGRRPVGGMTTRDLYSIAPRRIKTANEIKESIEAKTFAYKQHRIENPTDPAWESLKIGADQNTEEAMQLRDHVNLLKGMSHLESERDIEWKRQVYADSTIAMEALGWTDTPEKREDLAYEIGEAVSGMRKQWGEGWRDIVKDRKIGVAELPVNGGLYGRVVRIPYVRGSKAEWALKMSVLMDRQGSLLRVLDFFPRNLSSREAIGEWGPFGEKGEAWQQEEDIRRETNKQLSDRYLVEFVKLARTELEPTGFRFMGNRHLRGTS